MALSDTEKAEVIFQLGWPGLTIIPGSTDYSKPIVDNLTEISAPMEAQVRLLLTRIKAIDDALAATGCSLKVKQVDDIVMRDDGMYQLTREKTRLLRELSSLLDIQLLRKGGSNISVCV